LTANSSNSDAIKEFSSALIGLQTDKIWPHISVEIPFQPEIHQYLSESIPKKANREPLASLSSTALNGAQNAPKIPQNWIKNSQMIIQVRFYTLF
jgi:hypothetical protein